MRNPVLIAIGLSLLATGALAQSYDLTIHLSTGETVSIPCDEILTISFGGGSSGIDDGVGSDALPAAFQLLRNYPNPFNPSTTIVYEIPAASEVAVRVFDLHGRLVRELLHESQVAGRHEVAWHGTDSSNAQVASGVYFYAVTCDDEVQTRQMILVK